MVAASLDEAILVAAVAVLRIAVIALFERTTDFGVCEAVPTWLGAAVDLELVALRERARTILYDTVTTARLRLAYAAIGLLTLQQLIQGVKDRILWHCSANATENLDRIARLQGRLHLSSATAIGTTLRIEARLTGGAAVAILQELPYTSDGARL